MGNAKEIYFVNIFISAQINHALIFNDAVLAARAYSKLEDAQDLNIIISVRDQYGHTLTIRGADIKSLYFTDRAEDQRATADISV